MTYLDHLLRAYEGELVGEALYRRLAEASQDADRRLKLMLIADVERRTNRLLQPLAERFQVHALPARIDEAVQRRVVELQVLSWKDFARKAASDWPPYIAQFQVLRDLAPTPDQATLQVVVDHEVALVEFIRLECADAPIATSIQPLERYLAG
jgi:hypothetical protein